MFIVSVAASNAASPRHEPLLIEPWRKENRPSSRSMLEHTPHVYSVNPLQMQVLTEVGPLYTPARYQPDLCQPLLGLCIMAVYETTAYAQASNPSVVLKPCTCTATTIDSCVI